MHSEHILKERSDAQNVVSRFPCGDITRRRQAATTFGPEGRQPFSSQPFYATRGASRALFLTCGEAATTTLGPKGRQTYEPSGP